MSGVNYFPLVSVILLSLHHYWLLWMDFEIAPFKPR